MDYKSKYKKYKSKYINLKNYKGGAKQLLALQSTEIREQRLSRENANKNRERRAILEAQEIYQLQEREKKYQEIRDNLPNELVDLISRHNITECEKLFNMRIINKKVKNYIDNNIKDIYNYFRFSHPYLLNLDEEFRRIELLDLDIEEKISKKRQLVVNSCHEQKYEDDRLQYLDDEYYGYEYNRLESLFAPLGQTIYYLYRILKDKHMYLKFDVEEIEYLHDTGDLKEYLTLIINLAKKNFPYIFYNRMSYNSLTLNELRELDIYDINQIEILNQLIRGISLEKFDIIRMVGGIYKFFKNILEANFSDVKYKNFIDIFLNNDLDIFFYDAIEAVKNNFSVQQIQTIILLQESGFSDTYNAYAFKAVLNNFSKRQIEIMLYFLKKDIFKIKFNSAIYEDDFSFILQNLAFNVAELNLSQEKIDKIIEIINTTEPYYDVGVPSYEDLVNYAFNSVN